MLCATVACVSAWGRGRAGARELFSETISRSPAHPCAHAQTAEPATPGPDVVTEETTGTDLDAPWRVILYNDEVHTFEEVIVQLVKATGCSPDQAKAYTREVHTTGKAAVYEGDFEECFQVQGVLREIQLVTEIEG